MKTKLLKRLRKEADKKCFISYKFSYNGSRLYYISRYMCMNNIIVGSSFYEKSKALKELHNTKIDYIYDRLLELRKRKNIYKF